MSKPRQKELKLPLPPMSEEPAPPKMSVGWLLCVMVAVLWLVRLLALALLPPLS